MTYVLTIVLKKNYAVWKMSISMKFRVREDIVLIKTPATKKLDCVYIVGKKEGKKRKTGFSV